MTGESPRALYERVIEAIDTGDVSLLELALAPDVVDHNPVPGQPPGRAGFEHWLGVVRTAFPELTVDVEDVVVEGDRVAARVMWRGRHGGPFLGLPATGRPVEFRAHHMARVADGRIVEFWGVADLLGALEQLGGSVSGP